MRFTLLTVLPCMTALSLLCLLGAAQAQDVASTSAAGSSVASSSLASPAYECDVTGAPADGVPVVCPAIPSSAGTQVTENAVTGGSASGGAYSCSGGYYCGVRTDKGNAIIPVDIWNVCYWIDSTAANSLFVPFRTQAEWNDFVANKPSGITFVTCGIPWNDPAEPPPAASSAPVPSPPALYGSCSAEAPMNMVPAPDVYGRTAVSTWNAPSPVIQGFGGCGPLGNVTVEGQAQEWLAGNSITAGAGNLSWSQIDDVYSPSMSLAVNGATTATVAAGATVTLAWLWDSTAQSCSGNVLPVLAVQASSASAVVTPPMPTNSFGPPLTTTITSPAPARIISFRRPRLR